MIRVAVLGARGRMGSVTCEAVAADPELELVARVDASESLEEVVDAGADVAVDFTVPSSVKGNVSWLLSHGVHAVVGTTGLSDDDLAELDAQTGPANLFVAPNFAIGAVLMMQLAAQAARHLPHVEIIESHHDRKLDAPSGTALRSARLIAEARDAAPEPPAGDRDGDRDPSRGLLVDGVPVHSVRLPGYVASQEVILGGPGQTLTIRHDSLDRTSFMPGVLLAVKAVGSRPGTTVGLEQLL